MLTDQTCFYITRGGAVTWLRDVALIALNKVGCVAQLAERRSLAGELTLSYARPAVDG